jgi:chromosome segregation ATPase
MEWLKSKTTIVAIFFLAVAGVEGYGLMSMRSAVNERFTTVEEGNAQADEKLTALTSDVDALVQKLGVTEQELKDAQELTGELKLENARLRRSLTGKADSKQFAAFQKEATTKIDAVHQETSTKIDGINGDVKVVRTDLDSTRSDLKSTRTDLDATRSDLKATRDEVANSRRDLGTLIARNSSELADLRRKGERDYFEFDIVKSNQFKRVGDVMLQLKKTDVKKQKYEVVINADDKALQKKDRMANEPVTFLVGHDHLRYELVVNSVEKDRIRGYISSPKDRAKATEAALQ